MRLLVTGGAGYVGSIVAQHLVARGDEVTVFDSLYRGHRSAVPEGARLVEGDLLDPQALRGVLAGGCDGVLHFAAMTLVAESVAQPERYYRGNVVGTLNLLDAMREAGVPRLVFSSTAATYGDPESDPITEDEPTTPVNAYGSSKLAVDRMIGDHCRAHGLAAVSLRYFNVAGASGPLGEDHKPETHLIPLILQAAAGRRDHVSILGTSTGYSVRQVIDAVRRVTGREFEVREEERRAGDPPRLVAANDRAREALGWAPEKGLDEIVADAWAWHSAHPEGYGD
jgi:UDP-glucose 4-epimerase